MTDISLVSSYFQQKKQRTFINNKVFTRNRASFPIRPNGRSTDFVAPGFATGCLLGCTYCYVARHREYNPLEQYSNLDKIWDAVAKHQVLLPAKTPNQCDPLYWTYDIGESTDCLIPQNFHLTVQYLNYFIDTFDSFKAKPSFATKAAGNLALISSLPIPKDRSHARIRVSVAPQSVIDKTEFGTSTLEARIKGIIALYNQGYEVHLNFSPIIAYANWSKDYIELFKLIDQKLPKEVKNQLKCEVIFLTHSPSLHNFNVKYFEESEQLLWKPEYQEFKTTQRGDCDVVRYKAMSVKNKLIDMFRKIHNEYIPYCDIRYIF